jgi:hypothetical protein
MLADVIALGKKETDNIIRMITLIKQALRLFDCKNAKMPIKFNLDILIALLKYNYQTLIDL